MDKEAGWLLVLVASPRTVGVVQMAIVHLTSYSDCLNGFHEPRSPPNR